MTWRNSLRHLNLLVAFFVFTTPLGAAAEQVALKIVPVAKDVYALVGEAAQRSPKNLGNNATFGVVVTPAGVVLTDPGGSAKGAEMIADAIKTFTDKPVVAVINTGGQDHRWMGNGYFKKRGAKLYASAAAVEDQKERTSAQLTGLARLIGEDNLAGTEPVYADNVFEEKLDMEVGGVRFQMFNLAVAHTPGDTFVWLPDRKVVFTGDIVYVDRLLAVNAESSVLGWIEAFEAIEGLGPEVLVPGHGTPADLKKVRFETYEYLLNLRQRTQAYIDGGGDAQGSVNIDQQRFKAIPLFDQLSRRNAQAAFVEMEF
jgi:glyoxylase-like metal-dependent hydrolase (beta-lactamase superfamily II)